MHDDEIHIDEGVAHRLLRVQFPDWADRTITPVDSTGTVNAIFRLGDDLMIRMPRTSRWAVFRWIDGDTWTLDALDDATAAASQLARFVQSLQAIDTSEGPPARRRGLTAADHDNFRIGADAARRLVDTDALIGAWKEARQAPGWSGPPVWTHGDLLAANVLTRNGHVRAVIDWAGASIGDPAHDLKPAWTLFEGESRDVFRALLPFDDATWMRARALTLLRIINVAYYAKTNPRFSADAVQTLERLLMDWP